MYSHTDVMHRVIHPHSDIHTQIMYVNVVIIMVHILQ